MYTRLLGKIYRRSFILKRFVPIRRPVKLRLRHFSMFVRLDDWAVGLPIAIKRTYESHVTNVMETILKPGMVFVDIGASIGYYSLLAAALTLEGGKVISFEPSARSCQLLEMSLETNGFHNVKVHRLAVSDADCIVGYATGGGGNGIINRYDVDSLPYEVHAVKLDEFLQDEPQIDVVKMDIEGAEGLALAGMRNLLARHGPVVCTEFSPKSLQARSGVKPRDFLDKLREIGYDLHVIHRSGGLNVSSQSNDEIMADYTNYSSHHLDLAAFPNIHHPSHSHHSI
jgi:FkbM family methyltransferase